MNTKNDRSIDATELAAWLRLTTTPGVTRATARRLLSAFGSPQAAVAQGTSSLRAHLDADALAAWQVQANEPTPLLERTLQWLAQQDPGAPRRVLTLGDSDYPQAWLDGPDPPLCVYLVGQARRLAGPMLAIVGSRHPTPQGRDNARAFAAAFSQAGVTVVSGLALGIDTAAHEGALEGAAGTVAVVGTGLDRVYPKANHALAHRIATDGVLLSEFPLGTPPLAMNFPRRNRLIAGLGLGTLVVEAAVRSGSLITARLASEAGREVFAIPGSIHSPQARGCHWLIKQGAKLVETAQDVLEELRPQLGALADRDAPAPSPAAAAGPVDPLLAALGHDVADLDLLAARTGMAVPALQARLLELELEGAVERLPGGRYQRLIRA